MLKGFPEIVNYLNKNIYMADFFGHFLSGIMALINS